MIFNSFVLAGLTVGGFYFIFLKLPGRIRKFLVEKPLLTDVVSALFTYILFGGTATAIMAAGWACVIVSMMLAIRKNPFLMSWVNFAKDKLREFTAWVETFGVENEQPTSKNPPSVTVELH